jgi:hypothetical protein
MYRSKIAIASKLLNKETNLGNHHSLDLPKFKMQLLLSEPKWQMVYVIRRKVILE